MKKMLNIVLGDQVKDSITGFEGIVMAITVWLNQCRRIGVQSQKLKEDGTPLDIEWFDEQQIIKIKQYVGDKANEDKEDEDPGGPLMSIPKRNIDPMR